MDSDRYVVWWGYGCDADGCVWTKCWLIWPESKFESDAFAEAYAAGNREACEAAVRLLELDEPCNLT